MSTLVQRIHALATAALTDLPDDTGAPAPVELYDVEYAGGTLRIVLRREGGLDVGTISAATRAISARLDEADPIQGSYTLEVTSPGLERRLRTREHFEGALGERVAFKLRPGVEGDRRFVGEVAGITDEVVTVRGIEGDEGPRDVRLEDITRAQVHVDWTPPAKPGAPGSPAQPSDTDRTNHNEAT